MKLGLVADPHFTNFGMFSKPHAPGYGSRLMECIYAAEEAAEVFENLNVTDVIFLGDITHLHGTLTPPILNAVNSALNRFRCDTWGFSGNHDMDKNGQSILNAFQFTHTPILRRQLVDIRGVPIGVLPFSESPDELADDVRFMGKCRSEGCPLVLAHHHLEGAKFGRMEYVPKGGIPQSSALEDFTLVSGHYHMHQWVTDTWVYLGSMLQHRFDEVGNTPHVGIWDSSDGSLSFVELVKSPRFHILTWPVGGDIPGRVDRDYYRVDVPADAKNSSEVKNFCTDIANIKVNPIPIEADMRSRVEEYLGEKKKSDDVDLGDFIDAYTVLHVDNEDTAERRMALGRSIAESVFSSKE